MRYRWSLVYVLLIVAVNYAFGIVPLVELPDGTMWPPVSLAVGCIFVVRDLAQREIGHRVLFAMLAGAALSYALADPYIAVSSAAAFLVSELADWAIYSLTGRPFSERVLLSSALSTPLDSAVFLAGIGLLSVPAMIAMTASKMVAAVVVWWLVRRREQLFAGAGSQCD